MIDFVKQMPPIDWGMIAAFVAGVIVDRFAGTAVVSAAIGLAIGLGAAYLYAKQTNANTGQ